MQNIRPTINRPVQGIGSIQEALQLPLGIIKYRSLSQNFNMGNSRILRMIGHDLKAEVEVI